MDTDARNPDSVKQGYLFEVPVQKWSRTERAFKNRLLALTKSSVVEMDVATRSGSGSRRGDTRLPPLADAALRSRSFDVGFTLRRLIFGKRLLL